jgi:S1-C subfamily serine protease
VVIQHLILLAALFSPVPAADLKEAIAAMGQVLAGNDNSRGDTEVRIEGSGVVISPDGIVVTNSHVINNGQKPFASIYFNLLDPDHPFAALSRTRLYRAKILLENPAYDLVLLRIVSDADGKPIDPSLRFRAVPLGSSLSLSFLDEIYALGFPKAGGSTITVTKGQVSGKEELEGWIKTDAQVTHGSSGGAALDQEGKLIGIPTKVRPDIQEIDTDNDGFPDTKVTFGTVGLIRPVEMVAQMLDVVRNAKEGSAVMAASERVEVNGEVTSNISSSVGKALIGLLKEGSREATKENLLTWTRADDNGQFLFPLAVPPGKYTLRARAEGYDVYLDTVELTTEHHHLVIKHKTIEGH